MHAGREGLLGQRPPRVRRVGILDALDSLFWYEPVLPRRSLRHLRAREREVRGQLEGDLRRDREVGLGDGLPVRLQRLGELQWILRAGFQAVLGDERADVRRDGHLADDAGLFICVLVRRLHWKLHSRYDSVLGPQRPDMRCDGRVAEHHDMPVSVLGRDVCRGLHARCDEVQRQLGSDVRCLRAVADHDPVPVRLLRWSVQRLVLARDHPVLGQLRSSL